MKKGFKYILFITIFMVLVISITISILLVKYKDQGKFNVIRKNFNVVFTNAVVENEGVTVKIDNEKKFVHVEIEKLEREVEISLDIKNIANINALVKNFSYSNIYSNSIDGDVSITSSIKNGDVIKSGEAKKLIIKVKNNTNRNDIYYNFNVNYLFEEDKL